MTISSSVNFLFCSLTPCSIPIRLKTGVFSGVFIHLTYMVNSQNSSPNFPFAPSFGMPA